LIDLGGILGWILAACVPFVGIVNGNLPSRLRLNCETGAIITRGAKYAQIWSIGAQHLPLDSG
jgi:hypothetical protein